MNFGVKMSQSEKETTPKYNLKFVTGQKIIESNQSYK